MAPKKSENRIKAEKMWLDSGGVMKLKDIASELDVSDSQVRKWKNQDGWESKLNGNVTDSTSNVTKKTNGNVTDKPEKKKRGAQPGNLNALNNRGGAKKGNKHAVGHGAPEYNTNAVVTGEYQTIWDELLTEKEKKLMLHVPTEVMSQLVLEIKRFELREFRMMERIAALREKSTVVQLVVKAQGDSDLNGKSRMLTVTEEDAVDKIQRIEDALTRIQEKKGKYLELKFKLEQTEKENGWKEAELSRSEQNLLIKLEELAIKQEKLALDKTRILGDDDGEADDDGLIDRLSNVSEVWDGYDGGDE